jgi:hypothetical protein
MAGFQLSINGRFSVSTEAMEAGACHQYLEGPRDDMQVMASIGEYGDEWWHLHGR